MEKLGTHYGGWYIPKDIDLGKNSIIYSAGVGEDISFDLLLSHKYDCNILLLDPTTRSKIHLSEIKKYYKEDRKQFSGNIQKDYDSKINKLHPNFEKIKYLDIALWDKKEKLKFFKPENPNYVSHTLIEGMYGKDFEMVEATTIKDIMEQQKHDHIDLLKLDIEGAEVRTLAQMLVDKIFPKYILVEFDLLLQGGDDGKQTRIIKKKLGQHYKILINDSNNITYMLR